jgi:hypothetical protein
MEFLQEFYIGMRHYGLGTGASKHINPKIEISADQLETAADYAGSCYILEMGQHYVEYLGYGSGFPLFPPIIGYPIWAPHQLDTKSRASNVTGNIGETVTGIVVNRTLKFDSNRIAPLKVQPGVKTPDFLIARKPKFIQILNDIESSLSSLRMPVWWPVESKTRSDGFSTSEVKIGLKQLATYWYGIRRRYPAGVGYGVVIGADLKNPRRICMHVFVPKDKSGLTTYLKSFSDNTKYSEDLDKQIGETGKYLMHYA